MNLGVSFIVGLIPVSFGVEPETIYASVWRMARRHIDFGPSDVREIGRILLTGAMAPLPIWLALRLINSRRAR